MYNSIISPDRRSNPLADRLSNGLIAAMLLLLIGLSGGTAMIRAQEPANDEPGAQVLTRGPVHEAFAGIVAYNPEPGMVVTKAPPEAIEEVPPEERPEGDNVAWIPGYWAWDDERSDFLWISGTWRALPPGREWIAGYWNQTPQGYQWISGYWADATATETTYLPEPPATVENGPNIVAPAPDYGWTPGCWLWYQGHYAWRPGYWTAGRAEWDWVPAHYVWTPRGYIFVDGFWDYSVERRGVLFAPVYFESGFYAQRGYQYSPLIAINLSVFSDHLFLRPSYSHYYFGDYYAANYEQAGIYASFSFQSSRRGYDPFYSHERWAHREDREWEHRVTTSYQYRREHEEARPPRVWSAQININLGSADSKQRRESIAAPVTQLAKRNDGPVRYQPVAREERQQLQQRGQEVQKSGAARRTLEARPGNPSARKEGAAMEPNKAQLPRSPIVAKPAGQLGRNQTPPKTPEAPKPDSKVKPNAGTPGRQPEADRNHAQPDLRQPAAQQKSQPEQNGPAPTARPVQPVTPPPAAETKARQESDQRSNDAALKAQNEKQRSAAEQAQKVQQESSQQSKATAAKAAEESQRNARESAQQVQQQAEQQRAKESSQQAQQQAQRNTAEQARRAQQESEQQSKAAAAKAAEESQRNARASEQKAQQQAEQQRAKESSQQAQQESQRNATDQARKAQQESEQQSRAAVQKTQEDAQHRSKAPDPKPKKQPAPPVRKEPAPDDKDSPKPDDRRKDDR